MTQKKGPYFRILSQENDREATIMLYDYIGEYYTWDDDGRLVNAGVTDIEFVQELDRLAALYPKIHLRINSPGGEMYHGAAIVSAISRCKAEVHTWNDGIAASMAALIWAAGHERHMAKNATLMFHSGLWVCFGNPKDMRDCADTLDKMNDAMIAGMSQSTGITEEDLKARYFADYADHWLTFKDAETAGLINAMSEYQISDDEEPTALSAMNYKQLLAHFEKTQHPDTPGFRERVRAAFNNAIAAVTGGKPHAQQHHSPSDIQEMQLKDFTDSLAAGTLKLEEVQAHLATLTPPPPAEPVATAQPAAAAEPQTPPAVAPAPQPAATEPDTAQITAIQAQIATLTAEQNRLAGLVATYGAQPGATKSEPGAPATDLPNADGADTPEARLAAFNKLTADAATKNEGVNISLS